MAQLSSQKPKASLRRTAILRSLQSSQHSLDRSGRKGKHTENPTGQGGEIARRGHHQGAQEKRGSKGKVAPQEIKKMEDIINDGNIRHRVLPWAELAKKAGLVGDKQVHFHTVRKVSKVSEVLLLLPISNTSYI